MLQKFVTERRCVKNDSSRLRILCNEIYKTINSLSPSFMRALIKVKKSQRRPRDKYKLNLDILKWNQGTFGAKSLEEFGLNI